MPMGSVAGVRLRLHWSALVTVALVTVVIAGSVHPTGSTPAVVRWVVAGVGAAVFVASLAAHEVAHSVVAVRHGVPVRQITLWLLGGVSELKAEPPDPRTELRITLAGPLTSLGLGAVMTALAMLLHDVVGTVVVQALLWLGVTNVFLALFNMLPGAPLDGGRVLQAVLWRRGRDRLTAAAVAARAGRGLGLGLAVLGVVQTVATRSLIGLWLVGLGWFLRTAADAELVSVALRHRLGDLRVEQIMTPDPVTVGLDDDLADFLAHRLPSLPHRVFPVVDDRRRPVGVLSLAELASRRSPATVAGSARPLPERARVRPDMRVESVVATALMRSSTDVLAVVDDDAGLIGTVTATDIRRVVERTALGLPAQRRTPGGLRPVSSGPGRS